MYSTLQMHWVECSNAIENKEHDDDDDDDDDDVDGDDDW